MVDGAEEVEDVLVVEDNTAEIRFIEEAFGASGLDPTIHAASTKSEALDLLKQRGEYADAPALDAILLDWHLSKTTGQEVLEAAKAGDTEIPVMVMTGSKPELEALDSALPEADRCIEKQTEPEAYVEIFRDFVAEQSADPTER